MTIWFFNLIISFCKKYQITNQLNFFVTTFIKAQDEVIFVCRWNFFINSNPYQKRWYQILLFYYLSVTSCEECELEKVCWPWILNFQVSCCLLSPFNSSKVRLKLFQLKIVRSKLVCSKITCSKLVCSEITCQ